MNSLSDIFRALLLICVASCVIGCTDDQKPSLVDVSPAAFDNATTGAEIGDAQLKLDMVAQAGAKPGDTTVLAAATDLKSAQVSVQKTQAALGVVQKQAAAQAKTLSQAEKDRDYYKTIAASKVRYVLISLFLGAVVFYAGEWAKLSNPYTTLLPNVVAGMLAVMIFAALSAAVVELWDTFGWLIHLF